MNVECVRFMLFAVIIVYLFDTFDLVAVFRLIVIVIVFLNLKI